MIYTTRPGSELTVSAQNLHSEHSGAAAGRHKFPLKQLHIDLMNVLHSYLNQLDSRPPLITVGTLEDRSKGGLLLQATIKDHKSKAVDAAVSLLSGLLYEQRD